MRTVKETAHRISLILVWMVAPVIGLSQSVDKTKSKVMSLDVIQDSLVQRFERVEDYTATVKISIDMPRLRMPNKKVTLYYKRPDKMKVEADGFAVVPKKGLIMSPQEIFKNLFEIRLVGQENLSDKVCWIVEGIVLPDSGTLQNWNKWPSNESLVKTRLWIEAENWVIAKSESYSDTTILISIQTFHEKWDEGILLPRRTEVRFNVSGEFLEKVGGHEHEGGIFGESHHENIKQQDFLGLVVVEFSRYKINRGLKDEIFKDTLSKVD